LNRRLAPVFFRAALASRCVGHRYNQRMNPSAEFPAPEGATLVDCTLERHADQILAIFNDAIATSTALYDYKPRPRESMDTWFQTKQTGGFPVIGFESAAGELMGFASYGTFRAWPAYKYSVEHSVYVDGRHRGLGLGEALMRALIARARERDVHVLVGGIDAANQGSIRLHEKLGFKHAGTLREAGFKFGRWLDLAFYQLTLDTPANPVDG
jgi:phosphinothricin acetyltransferase